MAKICPITGDPVLYLDCLECEEKLCKKRRKQMKKNEYTFQYGYQGKGEITVAADYMDEAVEKASEEAQNLLPNNADPFSLEIGDLIDQTPICTGMR